MLVWLSKSFQFTLATVILGSSLVCVAQPSSLLKKDIVFDQIPEKLRLSQSSINCILQDREGYLWIGTWSGLIRYDGYSTTVFHSDKKEGSIKSNKITALFEDSHGVLWVGTQVGGLFRYDKLRNSFQQYFHDPQNPSSLSNNTIGSIAEDEQGRLWVGTDRGLNMFSGSGFRKFYSERGDSMSLSHNVITDIFLDSRQNLWIGTADGLNRLVKQREGGYVFESHFYQEDHDNYALHNFIYQVDELVTEGKSTIWLSSMKGLKKFDSGELKSYQIQGRPSTSNLTRSLLIVDGENPFILMGSETGLYFFDPATSTFRKFLDNQDRSGNLSQGTITSLYFDRGGVLWVGTKNGLNKFDSFSKNFRAHKTETFDRSKNIITGLQGSPDHGYWISTLGGGLFLLNDATFTQVHLKDNGKNDFTNFVQKLYMDSRGGIWVGTAGDGLYYFDEKKLDKSTNTISELKHYTTASASPLNQDFVMSIEEDGRGNIWVGTWNGGLNKITLQGDVVQYNQPGLKNVPLVEIHADLAGVLWIGTRGSGLYRVKVRGNDADIRIYKQHTDSTNSLSNNFINAIVEDHAGKLWIGTEDGLNSFDRRSETFSEIAIKDGPRNPVIVSILEDNAGKLWLAHWDGLSVIDPLNPDYVKNYDHHDHVQGGFFYNDVCYKDANGNLLFGGATGFNIINPMDIPVNPIQAPVVIQNFEVFNQPVPFDQLFNGRIVLDKPYSKAEVNLKHFENTISFEFAALDYAAPQKIRYAYMLEALDHDWNFSTSSRRYVNYTNLDYGRYTFKVKATNNDGLWNESVSKMSIVIAPPWWKTWWAVFIYIGALILVLIGFRALILVRANLIHDIKLERVQRENSEKLNRAKLQFFTNISHEFRTPLTLILGPIQHLMETSGGDKFVRTQLHVINNNAQRLLRLINQLLDFRKAETGNLKLEVTEGNLAKFIKEIKLSFDALAEEMDIDFRLHSTSNVIKAWFDRDQFEKIMFNLLSNAFKHTPRQGTVSISLIEGREDIQVIVEDSGKGINPEHFNDIFQTFFSYDEDRHHSGTGIGLALTKSLVDAHHGTIVTERTAAHHTRFIVKLLTGNAHFDQSEILSTVADSERIDLYPSFVPTDGDDEPETEPILQPLEDQPKLLIVEDNPDVRAYIKSIFLQHYVVLEAEEGKAGLMIAEEEIPDIIISDVMMPVMNGIVMTKALKSNVKTSHIPIILLTARTSLIFKVEGLETGADDYVNKPFNPKVLKLKVRNLIRTRNLMRKVFKDNDVLSLEPKAITLTSSDETFLGRMLDSIEENMSNADYSVEELGSDVGMSRMQLYRKLKALTGQSANEFMRTIRLKRAAQLLVQNQLTVAEITYAVGFNDLQYFRECFKKQFHITPSEYTARNSKPVTNDRTV